MTGPDVLRDRLGFTPGKVVRMFGMRRSGNHAIADWLQRNAAAAGSLFLNNCAARRNPLTNYRSLELNGKRVGGDARTHGATLRDGAFLLISYEDTSPAEAVKKRPISDGFDESLIDSEIVIYRGFLNWSASLLKKLQSNSGYSPIARNVVLLRAVDTYARILDLVERADALGLVAIRYEDWCHSAAYRADNLTRIGLSARDNRLGEVQPYGGGSSFQKDATDAADLQTEKRWQAMATDLEYAAVLSICARDPALTERLGRLFPDDAARLADGLTNARLAT
jgi:hypothetical protein